MRFRKGDVFVKDGLTCVVEVDFGNGDVRCREYRDGRLCSISCCFNGYFAEWAKDATHDPRVHAPLADVRVLNLVERAPT